MENKIELLAPAGDMDAFRAAIENGADAVYLGGKLFNARQFAGNFDNTQLKEAVDYAHIRDAKVYLTLNTLLSDSELKEALEFSGEAYLLGVDGIIVQDLGFAGAVKELYPDFELHASTQMTVYNLEGVKLLERLGFRRAVLARELPIEEIEYIAKNTPLEIEVFTHGALCICYSGQCLMSSIIGGRSGNRGKCAQPCRLTYELVGDKNAARDRKKAGGTSGGGKYLLSPKDLSYIEELRPLVLSGVKSLKIEGRMKSPEYVATVVRIYRKYLDIILNEQALAGIEERDMKDLTQIFNRGGFSKGYLRGKTGRDMMSYEKPKNWGIQLGEVISYDRAARAVRLRLTESLGTGDGIEVWNGEGESPGTVVSEIKVEGKSVKSAQAGEIASVGSINGHIAKGSKVYKTSDARLNAAARESFEGRYTKKAVLTARLQVKNSSPALLQVKDNRGNTVEAGGGLIPEAAVNRPISRERILEQLNKTGATPFRFDEIDIELEENLSLPISEINNIRRKALEEMEGLRKDVYSRKLTVGTDEALGKILPSRSKAAGKTSNMQISLLFYQWRDDLDYASLEAARLYIPFTAFQNVEAAKALTKCREKGCEVFAWLPSITRGNYDKLIKMRLGEMAERGLDGLLVGNLGSFEYAENFTLLKIMGDYSLNSFNSLSIKELAGLHTADGRPCLNGITLSLELNLNQIGNLEDIPRFTREAVIYGRIPLMTTEYCPVGSLDGNFGTGSRCNEACRKGIYRLKDRKSMEFPVLCDRVDCRSTILNSNVLFALDSVDRLKAAGVDMVRLNISDESAEDIKAIAAMHSDVVQRGAGTITEYKKLIDSIKERGFTKGHYYRGV